MRRPSRTVLSWVFVCCIHIPLTGQNIEAIGREKPFSFSGGISFNQIYYTSRGIAASREPYNFFASGNISFSLYRWTVPLSFSLSDLKPTFTQPFDRYAIHPTWKWMTLHAGYISMSFSPYTVNGHIFRGVGVDLDPGEHWKISALYGRFLKALEADSVASTLPAFGRYGHAVKVNYGDGRSFIELVLFHARDDENSIEMPHDSLHITPQENLAVSIGGSKTLFKHFVLKSEAAASVLTRDTRSERSTHHRSGIVSAVFSPKLSTSFFKALKSSFDYQREGWMLGFGYERIDPGYQTLGAYYFTNDLENLTVNGTARILKESLTIAVSAGLQKDNLDQSGVSAMRRVVSACNASYTPSEKFNLSGSWSAFQTFTNVRSRFETVNQLTPYDNLDTLNYTQISRSASLSGMYAPGAEKNRRKNLTLNLSWQESSDRYGPGQEQAATAFYNLSCGYAVSLIPQNAGLSVTFNASLHTGPLMNLRMMGPTASVTRSFFGRKLRTTLSTSWNKTRSNDLNIRSLFNARLNTVLSMASRHNFNLGAVLVRRTSAEAARSIIEFTATAGYQYFFGKRQ